MEKYLQNIPAEIKNIKIDIGLSYSAPQSNNWLTHEKNLLVFGFEPNPESIQNILQKNIKKKHLCHGEPLRNEFIDEKKFRLIPFALANVTEPTTSDFYCMTEDCGTSSLYKPICPRVGPVKSIAKVPVYSLKHFFELFPWDRFEYIDYIKIDAQGADLDIIKSAGDYLKNKVVFITAEPESKQYDGCQHNTTENMVEYLKTQNFEKINHPYTDDPTFLNNKFKYLYDKIYICQL
jgi:FkbM family methyltransferase